MGLEGWTPGYMIREKLKKEKLILRGTGKAWRYEERLREGKGSIWARRCLAKVEGKGMREEGKSKWEKMRGNIYRGMRSEAKEGERGE